MPTVFLSYAREDSAKVRPLAACLESAGHSVWWDQHISGGEQFAAAIENALNSADVVVVAWSAAAIRSPWVRDEAASGRDGDRLVPLTLDGCTPPLGFRQYQTIDLSTWNGRAKSPQLAKLVEAVAAKGVEIGAGLPPPAITPLKASLGQWPWAAGIAATLLLLLVAGALLVPGLPLSGSAGLSPKVRLGAFAIISDGVPRQLSHAVNQEILAAFGEENLVSVITAGASSTGEAPFLLDGSVRRIDDALRFTVVLKNSKNGMVVWSQQFDRASEDSLAPRQVAVAATQIVRCGLWGASSYPRRMPDQALALYLGWCNEYWGGASDEERVLDAARRVTAAVPDFSFGWSALALATVPLAHDADSAEARQIGREGWVAAERSNRLDGQNPEGYMAMAGLLPIDRFEERERLLRKAIAVRPSECGCERQAYGDFLSSVGRMEEAVEQYGRARAMMPLAPLSNLRFAHSLHLVGRHDEADALLDQMLDLWPNASALRLLKVKSAYWTGQLAEARSLLQSPDVHLSAGQKSALDATFAALAAKDRESRQRALLALRPLAEDPRNNDRLVVGALAVMGEQGAALDAASRLIRTRGPALSDVLFEPNLAATSHSAPYGKLVSSLGLTGYWKSSGRLPDLCRKPDKPGFCTIS